MARKAELLEQAKKLKLEVSGKNTIAEIEAAIKNNGSNAVAEEKSSTHEPIDENTKPLAKAGKRSAKAIKESEEQQAKVERKAQLADVDQAEQTKPKTAQKPARPKLERRSKAYKNSAKQIDKNKDYTLEEALELAVKTSSVKFDATVELHVNLSVDPRQADQNIRGNLVLPSGTGKQTKVAVVAEAEDLEKAKAAGADNTGEEVLASLEKGVIGFDVLIATPSMMPKLGKFARILGPKGLMPNPKSGTVTKDIEKAVREAKAGRVEFRVDSTGIIHLGAGKVSFGPDKLSKNVQAILSSIKSAKPASVKGIYVKSAYLTTAMGPSIKLSVTTLQ